MIILVIVAGILLFYRPQREVTFDDVSLKDVPIEEKNNSFAIMVENDSGTYEEYTGGNSWPTDMTFNEDLSGCIDMDGNEIVGALSFSDGKATVKTSSTTYCYLYFDKAKSSDATLSSLTASTGTLSPTFDSSTISYTLSITSSSSVSVTLSATTTDSNATVSGTGTFTASVGTTTKTITVTAEDGTTKTYAVKVSVGANALTLISSASSSTTSGLWASTLTNDGYRYVGTDPDNYICFGTDDTSICTSDTDLYMYRIIGIFADSSGNYHYKLIKKEALNTAYAWHSDNTTDTDWGDSDLYNGINGSYFLSNTTYSYMQDSTWTDFIETWTWTAVNSKTIESSYGPLYFYNTGQTIYYHESNQTSLITGTCYYTNSTTATCTNGAWTTPSAKIGLMYASDSLLSLGSSALSYTIYSNTSTLATEWMYIVNNDSGAPNTYEWTMARSGNSSSSGSYYIACAMLMDSRWVFCTTNVTAAYSVRPVFYLTSDTVITGGTGTSTDPYIIG